MGGRGGWWVGWGGGIVVVHTSRCSWSDNCIMHIPTNQFHPSEIPRSASLYVCNLPRPNSPRAYTASDRCWGRVGWERDYTFVAVTMYLLQRT